jgi:hypothetical protein
MVFDDTFRHEAWYDILSILLSLYASSALNIAEISFRNKSDDMRVVLMLDFAYLGDQSKRNQEFLKYVLSIKGNNPLKKKNRLPKKLARLLFHQ